MKILSMQLGSTEGLGESFCERIGPDEEVKGGSGSVLGKGGDLAWTLPLFLTGEGTSVDKNSGSQG